jgi:hypothetical protein
MAATLKSVREIIDIVPTEQDKGLTMTLQFKAYDNGQLWINGRHLSSSPEAWLGAINTASVALEVLQKEWTKRQ